MTKPTPQVKVQLSSEKSLKDSNEEQFRDSNGELLKDPHVEPLKDPNEERHKPENFLVRLCKIVYSPIVSNFILVVIIINAVILGLDTSSHIHAKFGVVIRIIDQLCLLVFCVELLMKMICEKFKFFLSAWNLFDFFIVGISVVTGTNQLSVMRTLRIIRAMRLLTKLPKLRMIAEAIIHALPSIGWISFLLIVIFYIFSVLTTSLFGEKYPAWFGNIGESMYTLFQMLTLDSWSSGITRTIMEEFPYAYMIFIPFVLISAFIIMNVFIGVIVNSIYEVSGLKQNLEKEDVQASLVKPAKVSPLAEAKTPQIVGPDHLLGMGSGYIALREQLNRIEDMLRSLTK